MNIRNTFLRLLTPPIWLPRWYSDWSQTFLEKWWDHSDEA